MGLRVVAIDTGAEKKKLCASYGADKLVPPCSKLRDTRNVTPFFLPYRFIDFQDYKDPQEMIKAIKNECDGVGPHAAVVAASGAAAYEQALEVSLRLLGNRVAHRS